MKSRLDFETLNKYQTFSYHTFPYFFQSHVASRIIIGNLLGSGTVPCFLLMKGRLLLSGSGKCHAAPAFWHTISILTRQHVGKTLVLWYMVHQQNAMQPIRAYSKLLLLWIHGKWKVGSTLQSFVTNYSKKCQFQTAYQTAMKIILYYLELKLYK